MNVVELFKSAIARLDKKDIAILDEALSPEIIRILGKAFGRDLEDYLMPLMGTQDDGMLEALEYLKRTGNFPSSN